MNYVNNHQLECVSAMQITFISCTVPFVHASTFANSQTERQHFYLVPMNLESFARLSENEMCDCSFKERYCHVALWETLGFMFWSLALWKFSNAPLLCFEVSINLLLNVNICVLLWRSVTSLRGRRVCDSGLVLVCIHVLGRRWSLQQGGKLSWFPLQTPLSSRRSGT